MDIEGSIDIPSLGAMDGAIDAAVVGAALAGVNDEPVFALHAVKAMAAAIVKMMGLVFTSGFLLTGYGVPGGPPGRRNRQDERWLSTCVRTRPPSG
ncbi:MAG TPA: hypothetical protein VD763_02570 [Candidatus Saccharimonadales bacterium]|nr:hypothetical protein [Candidatus Saccharimonadales bacterium]